MDTGRKLIFTVLSVLLWCVTSALLAWPFELIWNRWAEKFYSVPQANWLDSFCILLVIGLFKIRMPERI